VRLRVDGGKLDRRDAVNAALRAFLLS